MLRTVVCAAGMCLCAAALAQATPEARRGPIFGTFSSLIYGEESGDVGGMEVSVLPQFDTARVIFQCAAGYPDQPVFVHAKTTATTVAFDINVDGGQCNGHYEGRLTPAGLVFHIDGNKWDTEPLPRRKSYWVR